MAEGLRQIAGLSDPIGEVLSMKNRPNGLRIGKKRVPLGVVGIIYESRPNVTADAFGLCFKTGNAVILRGGSDAVSYTHLDVYKRQVIRHGAMIFKSGASALIPSSKRIWSFPFPVAPWQIAVAPSLRAISTSFFAIGGRAMEVPSRYLFS